MTRTLFDKASDDGLNPFLLSFFKFSLIVVGFQLVFPFPGLARPGADLLDEPILDEDERNCSDPAEIYCTQICDDQYFAECSIDCFDKSNFANSCEKDCRDRLQYDLQGIYSCTEECDTYNSTRKKEKCTKVNLLLRQEILARKAGQEKRHRQCNTTCEEITGKNTCSMYELWGEPVDTCIVNETDVLPVNGSKWNCTTDGEWLWGYLWKADYNYFYRTRSPGYWITECHDSCYLQSIDKGKTLDPNYCWDTNNVRSSWCVCRRNSNATLHKFGTIGNSITSGFGLRQLLVDGLRITAENTIRDTSGDRGTICGRSSCTIHLGSG